MTVKRSRISHSSSFRKIHELPRSSTPAFGAPENRLNGFSAMASYERPPKVPKPSAAETEQSRPSIWFLDTSEVTTMNDQKQARNFLDKCRFCRKRLLVGKENLFMYGSFGVFCSTLCRAKQILLDKSKQKFAKQSTDQSGSPTVKPFHSTFHI